jgi:cell division transport system permease protein
MARMDYFFRETVIGLRRNGLVVFAAVSTAFIALLLLGIAQLIIKQVDLIVANTTGRVEVVVYLSDSTIGTPQEDRIGGILSELPQVETVGYESKKQAYEHAKELFGPESDIIQNVSPDAFPASYRVKLVDPEDYKVIDARLSGEPGIEEISAQQEFLDRLFAVTRVFRIGVSALAIVMLIASAILIANTVRMGLFARRKEIGIMKLVGATNWRIRVPFLIEGIVEGLVGGALAVASLFVFKVIFINPLYGNITFIPWIRDVDVISTVPIVLGVGVAVSLLASVLAMRRFLDV